LIELGEYKVLTDCGIVKTAVYRHLKTLALIIFHEGIFQKIQAAYNTPYDYEIV